MRKPWLFTTSVLIVICLLLLSSCGSSSDSTDEKRPAALESVEQAALEKYRWYLEENAASLVDWTTQMRGQIAVGELGKAESRYSTSRVQYGQVEPGARLLPALNTRINALAKDVPADEFGGFHRIEKTLFGGETTSGATPAAKALMEDAGKLHHGLRTIDLEPRQIAAAINETLEATLKRELTGGEEPYSHLDLVDFAASVEGTEAAFEAIRPLVAYRDQDLAESIEARFVEAYEAVKLHGSAAREDRIRPAAAGAVFIVFNELSTAEVRQLRRPIDALAALFAQVPSSL